MFIVKPLELLSTYVFILYWSEWNSIVLIWILVVVFHFLFLIYTIVLLWVHSPDWCSATQRRWTQVRDKISNLGLCRPLFVFLLKTLDWKGCQEEVKKLETGVAVQKGQDGMRPVSPCWSDVTIVETWQSWAPTRILRWILRLTLTRQLLMNILEGFCG